jgi:oxygen-dependent protoporphyrinogen oxidase
VRVVVLGRGISGLAAAHFLTRAGHDVMSIDPAAEPGGFMRSERVDGFLCEIGPQALLDGPAETRQLIADAGLESRLVRAQPTARRRFIHARGRLQALPGSPIALVRSGLLSWRGKLRLLREPFLRNSAPDGDESVLAFGTRRFGEEAARALVATAVIGIYAGDAADLSAPSALPRLAALERTHGSVIRGAIKQRRSGGGFGKPVSFPDGLQELARALDRQLGARRIVAGAERIERQGQGWRVAISGGAPPIDADAVVVATGAGPAAALLDPLAPAAASALRQVRQAPAAVVCLGFRGADIGIDLRAYGFLVARDPAVGGAPSTVLGCQYESSIFAGRAPEGAVLLRAILGGTFDPGVVDESDEVIRARTVADLRRLAGLTREPDFVRIWRHRDAIPQYALGHAALVAAVDADLARHPGLHLIGHTLRGVGLNDCIAAANALPGVMR